mgnify:FL=1
MLIAGPAGTKKLRTLHMGSINALYEKGHPLRYTTEPTRSALLYVAARFMMVRIDTCAKRRAASAKRQASWNLNMPQAKYLKVF